MKCTISVEGEGGWLVPGPGESCHVDKKTPHLFDNQKQAEAFTKKHGFAITGTCVPAGKGDLALTVQRIH
jgi:hypothetical protein